MTWLEVAAGWVMLTASVGLGWVWWYERRRVRQFCAVLDSIEADLRRGTARDGIQHVLYDCCDHCAINPKTGVCRDLEYRGGHRYKCGNCDEGRQSR